jgi:hypothetical protein
MRLSEVLSKSPSKEFKQVDGFLQNKKGNIGQKVNIDVGKIGVNYFCKKCNGLSTFCSSKKLSTIFVNKNLISIHTVLCCSICNNFIPTWFLIESNDDITGQSPHVKIIKKSDKLINLTRTDFSKYKDFTKLLDKAQQAYNEELGAGAIIYLRKVFEKVTIESAKAINFEYKKYENGNPKNFCELLKNIDEKCSIIPKEFSKNSYRLFRELSEIIHGEYDDNIGISKFELLQRLIIGILDNINNNKELLATIKELNWDTEGEKNE